MDQILTQPVCLSTRLSLLQSCSALLSPALAGTLARSSLRAAVLSYLGPGWLVSEVRRAASASAASQSGRDEAVLYAAASLCWDAALAPALRGCWRHFAPALLEPALAQHPRRQASALSGLCGLLLCSSSSSSGGHYPDTALPTLARALLSQEVLQGGSAAQALQAMAVALQHPSAPPVVEAGDEQVLAECLHRVALLLGTRSLGAEVQARCLELLAAWLQRPAAAQQQPQLPQWAHLLRSAVIAQLAVPEAAWVGGPGGDGSSEAEAAGASRAPRACRALALRLLAACSRAWGEAWLHSAPAPAPAADAATATASAAAARQPPTGLKALLLLARLVAVELKECIESTEELLVLPSTSGGASAEEVAELLERFRKVNPDFSAQGGSYVDAVGREERQAEAAEAQAGSGGEQAQAMPVAEALKAASSSAAAPVPAPASTGTGGASTAPPPTSSVPALSRAARNSQAIALHSQLCQTLLSGLEAYSSLVALAGAVKVEEAAAAAAGGSAGAEAPALSLLPSLRDTLCDTAGLLLALPADVWNGQLHPALLAMAAASSGSGSGSGSAALSPLQLLPPPGLLGGDLERASLPFRAALAAPLAAAAGAAAACYLAEDEDAKGAELLDALPLFLALSHTQCRVVALPAPPPPPPQLSSLLCSLALGPPGPLHHPLPRLLPALAARVRQGGVAAALCALPVREACLRWLQALGRGIALDCMALDAAAGSSSASSSASSSRASLNAAALSLGCVACALTLELLQEEEGEGGQGRQEGLAWGGEAAAAAAAAAAARELLAVARRCAGARAAGGVQGGSGGRKALLAFSRHATALAAVLQGVGARDAQAQAQHLDACFECFQGLALGQGGSGHGGGEAAPFEEHWADAEQLLHIAMAGQDGGDNM